MKRYMLRRVYYALLRYTVGPVIKLITRYNCEKQKGPLRPSIVISNHNSDIDPAFVGMAFSRQMYFLASEHAFRRGLSSMLIKHVFDPIPFNKNRNDISAIKEMLSRLKSGANVCLFAEGNRSFNGLTGKVQLSTAKLVKSSGADLVTFRLEGGYFSTPRWGKSRRRGRITGRHINSYTAEQMKEMAAREVNDFIERDIYEDAYGRQQADPIHYVGKALAENIETALYLCPGCERIGTIRSKNERFFCDCGLSAEYLETGMLQGDNLPFSTITQWDCWQSDKLEEIIRSSGVEPICSHEGQTLYSVVAASGSKAIGTGTMSINRHGFRCAGHDFPIDRITKFAVAGQMTLQFADKDGVTYEVHSETPRSALLYREIFRILTEKVNHQ